MLTAVLVDDMPQALQVLENDLSELFSDIKIIGKADGVVSAAKLLRQEQPDLLFLDIMLGDGTGFDLLEIFPNLNSKVIFVTASEEHALKAFRFAAIDYLLKPINPDDLKAAVNRAKDRMVSKESLSVLKETMKHPDAAPTRISLHTQEKIAVVEIAEIVRLESLSNNTRFILNSGEKIFVTKTLKQYETMFSGMQFVRVHQSHFINTNYIHEYVRKEGGYLKMKNGDHIPVSVRKKSQVIELLDRL